MNCLKYLNSFDEIAELVSAVQKRRAYNPFMIEHYRGQGRPEYKLLPNVARGLTDFLDVENKEKKLMAQLNDELKRENLEYILRRDPYLSSKQSLWNDLVQAQHIGIPTRFLDWSLRWEVDLWFAVENSRTDDVDGQFWIFSVPDEIIIRDTNSSDPKDNYYNKDLENLDKTYFVNIPTYWSVDLDKQIGETKRGRQFGRFSVSSYANSLIPLEEQPEILAHLEKYCIPSSIKGQIRLELTSQGLNKNWLYYRDNDNEAIDKIVRSIMQS